MKAEPLSDFELLREEIVSAQRTLVVLQEEKRSARSRSDKRFLSLVEGVLETLDMCERLQEQEESAPLRRVIKKLERTLADQGIEPIQLESVAPQLCRVVEVRSDTSKPTGAILGTLRRGFRRGDTVLRLADVISNRN